MPDPENNTAGKLNLPVRTFMYTIDQMAVVMSLREITVKRYLHYDGRTFGPRRKDMIRVVNIALDGEAPVWRASETEFVRFLKYKGFKFGPRSIMY